MGHSWPLFNLVFTVNITVLMYYNIYSIYSITIFTVFTLHLLQLITDQEGPHGTLYWEYHQALHPCSS